MKLRIFINICENYSIVNLQPNNTFDNSLTFENHLLKHGTILLSVVEERMGVQNLLEEK